MGVVKTNSRNKKHVLPKQKETTSKVIVTKEQEFYFCFKAICDKFLPRNNNDIKKVFDTLKALHTDHGHKQKRCHHLKGEYKGKISADIGDITSDYRMHFEKRSLYPYVTILEIHKVYTNETH